MPTSKYHFYFETLKQLSISDRIQETFSDRIQEAFSDRFQEIPPEIEDAIEQLLSEMEPFPSEILYTLDELVDDS